jgi:ribonucleoside-triphosphate reductase
MQREWYDKSCLPWPEAEQQEEAEEMYDRIYNMKFLPPGRGLWAMGTALTSSRKLYAALNNCAFVSTSTLASEPTSPFCWLMDASMLGVGVGFDTLGAGKVEINRLPARSTEVYVVDDSREGWVDSLRALLTAYLGGQAGAGAGAGAVPIFDYSQLRPKGAPIKGFGGTSQGGEPLRQLHEDISNLFSANPAASDSANSSAEGAAKGAASSNMLSVTDIVDVMNMIGKCVVSGNVRRTAEIAFGDPDSEEYIGLKDYKKHPRRADFGWTSNNSVLARLGMDYSSLCRRIVDNGEPGFAWLENMRAYGRMGDAPNHKDHRAAGGNPCLEQTLESKEMCCLVETFPHRHDSLEDFQRTLKFAVIYAKTVTLGPTHWPDTNAIMLRNRRIGTSMSGIAQFIASRGVNTLQQWCDAGYDTVQSQDRHISERFAVPQSIKTTCIKPSGTVSLLAGATPGMHFPESRFYIRRVRLDASSPLVPALREAGYNVEGAESDPANTMVVDFPIDAGEGVRTLNTVSMWEQLSLAAFLQKHWADNQVSCTVTFNPETESNDLANALNYFQYQLKGVSFLPRLEKGAYAQMPYEEISESEYRDMYSKVRSEVLDENLLGIKLNDPVPDKFCESDSCSTITIS